MQKGFCLLLALKQVEIYAKYLDKEREANILQEKKNKPIFRCVVLIDQIFKDIFIEHVPTVTLSKSF